MGTKFKIGQSVIAKHSGVEARGVFEIVRVLPELPNGERQYRIRLVASGMERVVREAEIKAA